MRQVPLRALHNWRFDEHLNLEHVSGRFFSIRGVQVKTNFGPVATWSQPLIFQPEIGILGLLCQQRAGGLSFLMQAKLEPGNIGQVQLSPTIQATKSNYFRVHGGHPTPYLEFFINPPRHQLLVDQLQSEQGARFFRKRNRNMIVALPPETEVSLLENYVWLTLGEIKGLLQLDNVVNMDSRSVLSCLPVSLHTPLPNLPLFSDFHQALLQSLSTASNELYSIDEILSWLAGLKVQYELEVSPEHLANLTHWQVGEHTISHISGKYFEVLGVEVSLMGREVNQWCQPLLRQQEQGLVGFILRRINGLYHFLVQAKLEVGNLDIIEMAPTVQCITGSYTQPEYTVPYLEFFLHPRSLVRYDQLQSEEGGRFYQEQNRYMVIEVGDDFPVTTEARYIWMTLHQIKQFIRFNNYFNIEARSLLTCLLPI